MIGLEYTEISFLNDYEFIWINLSKIELKHLPAQRGGANELIGSISERFDFITTKGGNI